MIMVTLFSITGIILAVAGACLVYRNSFSEILLIEGGCNTSDLEKKAKMAGRKNTLLKVGVILVVAGSLFQLISMIMPEEVVS